MKKNVFLVTTAMVGAAVYLPFACGQPDAKVAPIYGITLPPGYRDWKLISVAHEEGNLNDLRAIVGNNLAAAAFRDGKLPYP